MGIHDRDWYNDEIDQRNGKKPATAAPTGLGSKKPTAPPAARPTVTSAEMMALRAIANGSPGMTGDDITKTVRSSQTQAGASGLPPFPIGPLSGSIDPTVPKPPKVAPRSSQLALPKKRSRSSKRVWAWLLAGACCGMAALAFAHQEEASAMGARLSQWAQTMTQPAATHR